MQPLGIYVHVPFCASKCPYCDFYSKVATPEDMSAYTEALLRAAAQGPVQGRPADTVYFGGGTPNLLGAQQLCAVLQAVGAAYPLVPGAEVTLEGNPGSLSLPLLARLREGGFNRLSMGMQSASPEELTLLGRRHTPGQVAQSVELARQAGFENISLDLMLGTPAQTQESALASADRCAALGVEHISAYMLKVEPDTPYGRQHMEEQVMDSDRLADLYLALVERLEELGYHQYEISNFAKPGYRSRHNLKYWNGDDYLGLGPSAHSLVEGRRFFFPRDLAGFTAAAHPFALACEDGAGGTREEYIMLRLRLTDGLDLVQLAQRFPGEENETLVRQLAPLAAAGLLTYTPQRVTLTPSGFLVSNAIIARLLT